VALVRERKTPSAPLALASHPARQLQVAALQPSRIRTALATSSGDKDHDGDGK
jgi:hypothetical protein